MDKVSFLDVKDVKVIKKGNQPVTDLYVNPLIPTNIFKLVPVTFFVSKRSIPYSQALRLNRICSENSFFDKQCNDLEIWLKGKG